MKSHTTSSLLIGGIAGNRREVRAVLLPVGCCSGAAVLVKAGKTSYATSISCPRSFVFNCTTSAKCGLCDCQIGQLGQFEKIKLLGAMHFSTLKATSFMSFLAL